MYATQTPSEPAPSHEREIIGRVLSVAGSSATIELAGNNVGDASRATVGKFIGVVSGEGVIIGMITEVSEQADGRGASVARIDLFGEMREHNGLPAFSRGITDYPAIGEPALLMTNEELRLIYGNSRGTAHVGSLRQDPTIKALVETGRSAQAQTMILAELDRQLGGSARAARNTFGGALSELRGIIGNVFEEIGGRITPVLRDVVERLIATSDAWIDLGEKIGNVAAGAIMSGISGLQLLKSNIELVKAALLGLLAVQVVSQVEGWVASLRSFGTSLASVNPILAGIAVLFAGIAAYTDSLNRESEAFFNASAGDKAGDSSDTVCSGGGHGRLTGELWPYPTTADAARSRAIAGTLVTAMTAPHETGFGHSRNRGREYQLFPSQPTRPLPDGRRPVYHPAHPFLQHAGRSHLRREVL